MKISDLGDSIVDKHHLVVALSAIQNYGMDTVAAAEAVVPTRPGRIVAQTCVYLGLLKRSQPGAPRRGDVEPVGEVGNEAVQGKNSFGSTVSVPRLPWSVIRLSDWTCSDLDVRRCVSSLTVGDADCTAPASIAVHLGQRYLAMMKHNLNWPAIVALTQEELKHGFDKFDAIDFSKHDAAVLGLSNKLTALEKARPAKLRRQIMRRRDFDLVSVRQAFSAGLSPDGEARHSVQYNQMLLVLSRQAQRDQIAYDALAFHATIMISDGRPLVPELRMFLIDVAQAKLVRPKRSRAHKSNTYYRNQVIYWVIEALCEKFNLTATRNDEVKGGHFSACDAVAEAMVAMRRTPQSFKHIKDIWLLLDSTYGPAGA